MNTILLVEDDADLRRGMALRLRHARYAVVQASDGDTAVMLARATHPDLLLLDIGLPGSDGFAVLRRLQKMTALATTPVIVITGRDPQNTWGPAMELGAIALFQKPVDNAKLFQAIKAALA